VCSLSIFLGCFLNVLIFHINTFLEQHTAVLCTACTCNGTYSKGWYSLAWPDRFFPFVLGPPTQHKREKVVWPRETRVGSAVTVG